jgi:5-formyltetrahydrofolate cyclo-ligase
MSIVDLKAEIRIKAKRYRAQLSQEYRKAADLAVGTKFLSFLEAISDIRSIGLYWPTEYEVDTCWLLEKLYNKKYICALPKIDEQGMCFLEWTPTTIMKPNKNLRFTEPFATKEIVLDLIVVPLLTCDMQGHRLGSGKGWYDKYLASHKAIKVGLCYSKMLSKTLPNEQHDISLDIVITETGSY